MNPEGGGGLLRVVVDTNAFISAFLHPERPIFQIVQQAAEGRYHLLISPVVVREVGRVLRETFGFEERARIHRLKTLTKAAGEIITPKITLDVIKDDPPDNRVLECAIEGRADLIVSGDRHLRRLKNYQGIPIVRPTDFLRTLGAEVKRR
jgi:putative PIN family toxin of toxin-antitoxin system